MSNTADRPVASAVRPGLRQSAQPPSPHTPNRTYSSNFSSPGAGFRQEEDALIFELGSRFLRAGFEGEASPQCSLTFGPETSRRVGDYRDWEPELKPKQYKLDEVDVWSRNQELWEMDLKNFDLGLFEDKLERAIREVYNKYLLTDPGSHRLVLVVPPLISHPLLSSLLTLLFTRWNYPSIGLLPSPTMATFAAGVRSALVVDIGWQETTVTSVYEYRETESYRSVRAMKHVVKEMAKFLFASEENDGKQERNINFDFAEEIVTQLGWCRGKPSDAGSDTLKDQMVDIDMPAGSSIPVFRTSVFSLSEPIESSLFATNVVRQDLDDEELPLPDLIFKALAALPPDVRGTCMSRILFVGGGSQIAGLSERVLDDLAEMSSKYGWNTVRGEVVEKDREKLKEITANQPAPNPQSQTSTEPEADPIEEMLRRMKVKEGKPPVRGILREVKSLGSWSGASLLTSMKVRGIVEVERERFLMYGLSGAHRDTEISVVPQRQSFGPGIVKGAGDRSSWTLAGWG